MSKSLNKIKNFKEVSFNWLQFLWAQIGMIRKSQADGNIDQALLLLSSLVDYLPDDMKEKFKKRCDEVQANITLIRDNKIPQIQRISDVYQRHNFKRRVLQQYCGTVFPKLISEITSSFAEKGYMERKEYVEEGYGHTTRT